MLQWKRKEKKLASVQLHTYALLCILMNLSCHHGNGTIKFLPNLVPVSWCLSSRVEGYLKQLVDVVVAYLLLRHAEQTTSVSIGLMSGDATVWRRNGLESLQARRTALMHDSLSLKSTRAIVYGCCDYVVEEDRWQTWEWKKYCKANKKLGIRTREKEIEIER